MLTEASIMKTEAIFSDDRSRRYLLSKVWDAKKPRVTIIMTNPSTADINRMDFTTMYILNNLVALGEVGGADLVNLVSKCTTKLNIKKDLAGQDQENTAQILKCAEKADKIILAWGSMGNNNLTIRRLQDNLLEQLRPYKEKLYLIGDGTRTGFHPLAPQIRFNWVFTPFEYPKVIEEDKKEEKSAKRGDK